MTAGNNTGMADDAIRWFNVSSVRCKDLMELGYADGMAAREQVLHLLGREELVEAVPEEEAV